MKKFVKEEHIVVIEGDYGVMAVDMDKMLGVA